MAAAVEGGEVPVKAVAGVVFDHAGPALLVKSGPFARFPLGPLPVDLYRGVLAVVTFGAVLSVEDGLGEVGAGFVLDFAQNLARFPEEGEVADGTAVFKRTTVVELAIRVDPDPPALLQALGINYVEVRSRSAIGPLGGVGFRLGEGEDLGD